MATHEILTVAEIAVELRCSKAYVYNVIAGKVDGVERAAGNFAWAAGNWSGESL